MATRRHVRVVGPLAPYAVGFDQHLAKQGFHSSAYHLYLMAQLSVFLGDNELEIADLSASALADFPAWRFSRGYVSEPSPRRMSQLLDYLAGIGVVVSGEPQAARSPSAVLIERYRQHLVTERGLAAPSVRAYVEVAVAFLSSVLVESGLDVRSLTTADVTGFVLIECRRIKVASAKATTTRLRSFLRFLYVEGMTAHALGDAVPSVANWSLGSLPRGPSAGEITRLLKSCDRRRAVGRRDFAVLTVLGRLGLRAGEVARLELGDIAWRAGELTVRGKGDRRDRLPLPKDVGTAIVAWLQRGRPPCASGAVFVRVRAPHRALSSEGVSAIVQRACQRAGLARVGAHRLRHSAATAMLRAGSSLDEVGQVLRHERRATTQIYAKVDDRALSAVVRPWPGARP
jgi:integrase/recombinase XerD